MKNINVIVLTGILTPFRKRAFFLSKDFTALKSKVTHFYNGVCNEQKLFWKHNFHFLIEMLKFATLMLHMFRFTQSEHISKTFIVLVYHSI